ncbi:MAG: ribosomal RNA small subunit methyltransferase A [Candidatus Brocadiae bacterium]|nr:ribosomal RNA small subunit methyltransferase A [Candidatus Brocadiia bacterium]
MNDLAKQLLDAGFRPRRRFGQNFLFDDNFLAALIREAALSPDDLVLEIGTGPGQLTERLAAHAAHVVTAEIDERLHAFARGRIPARNVDFWQGDAIPGGGELHRELVALVRSRLGTRRLRMVANLPYAVGGAILLALAEEQLPAADALCTLQEEVADRLCAGPGDEAYGPLGILLGRRADVRKVRDVPPQLFWPMPRVQSSLVHIRFGVRPFEGDWTGYKTFVKAIFGFRRKTLQAGLRRMGRGGAGEFASARPEMLTPGELETVWRAGHPGNA